MVMTTTVMDGVKMENVVPRARLEATYLAIWASVLTSTLQMLNNVTTLPLPICQCNSLPDKLVQITTLAILFPATTVRRQVVR